MFTTHAIDHHCYHNTAVFTAANLCQCHAPLSPLFPLVSTKVNIAKKKVTECQVVRAMSQVNTFSLKTCFIIFTIHGYDLTFIRRGWFCSSARHQASGSCGSGVEPTSCYWKVAGWIPLVCMSKSPLER